MAEPRQLIVLGSSLTALAVVRSASALGLRVVLVDGHRGIAFQSRYPQSRMVVCTDDHPATLHRLLTTGQELPTAVIADSDDWLTWLVSYRAQLEAGGLTLLHPANDVLSRCLDKKRFALWCLERGWPVPALFQARDSTHPPPSLPAFVRPRTTRHAELTAVPKAAAVSSLAELQAVLEVYRRLGVEAVVSASLLDPELRQYSYGFARNRDGEQRGLLMEKLRPHPDRYATGSLVVTADRESVQDLARRLIADLGFVGIGEVELLHNERTGTTHVVEVNARPWLQFVLASASGLDLLRFHLWPTTYDPDRETGQSVRWISLGNDLFNCFSRQAGLVRRGEISWRDYLFSLLRPRIWAAASLQDPLPGVSLGWRTLSELLRRSNGPGPASALPASRPRATNPASAPRAATGMVAAAVAAVTGWLGTR